MTRIYEDATDTEGFDPDEWPAATDQNNSVAAAREVVATKGARIVQGTLLDAFTASAIVAVADKCEEIGRRDLLEKLEAAPIARAAALAWKCVG